MLNPHLIAKTSPRALPENIIIWNDIRLTVLGEKLFRIEKDERKGFCDQATQTVWFRDMPPVSFTVKKGKTLTLKTSEAVLCINEDIMKSTVTVDKKRITLGKAKNLPGAYRTLDRCDGDTYYSWQNVPSDFSLEDGIVSKDGVGILDDTSSLILGEDGKPTVRDDDQLDIYVFAHGNDYRGAVCDLYKITGDTPLIPKYAFGNWWSRYHEYTETEYLHILDKLAERDVPLTVATIDMDWHWSTTLDQRKGITASGKNDEFHGGAHGWTGYSWNTDLFPDYRSFLKKIKQRDLKITLNLHPADGIRYFEDMYEEMAIANGIDPKTEAPVPFNFTSDDFINSYFDIIHKPYEHDGVDFWWMDWQHGSNSGIPGLDPLWLLNHYHTLDNAKEHLPLLLSRYCKIGSHRYPLGFSGDTFITWKVLDYLPYFTAMGTNAGYTWWSHDIGGHSGGFKDDELYMRFVQFGVFSPINRLHCCCDAVVTKEPSFYMNGKGMIAEDFLRLRHKMIPFLYSASYKTHEKGDALIEPMYYAYPTQKDAYRAPGQYLFGQKFIVAPITQKGNRDGLASKKVWLPEGRWTDIFTGDEYSGGAWTDMYRWMETIPVLASEGAIMVLDGRSHTNSIENSPYLHVLLFNGNGEYVLHEDKDDARLDTVFTSSSEDGKQILTLTTKGDRSIMKNRDYRFEFRNIKKGSVSITENGKPVDFILDDAGDYIEITLKNAKASAVYTVCVEYTDDRTAYRNARILYNMMRLEGEHEPKNAFALELFALPTEEAKAVIAKTDLFNSTQKKRLCEAW